MKRIGLFLLIAVVAGAQDQDLTAGMKMTAQAMNVLRKLEKKTGPEAMRSAEQIGVVYETMINFWRQRNALDAVKLSEQGKGAAGVLASAVHAGDEAKAAEAIKAISGTCAPCHEAHREKLAEGKYRVK
ncbi:MAG: cytochrome c [Bryobacteraceae bacterium]|nr:cytochrome c [Bryobacteraceae bacterium]